MFRLPDCFFTPHKPLRKAWSFDFVIESLKKEEAEFLMKIIILYAESHKTFVGGGCAPSKDTEDEQK